jgi:hypothetical protein
MGVDKSTRASDPEKYETEVGYLKAAFPEDWKDRLEARRKAVDSMKGEFCGKWLVSWINGYLDQVIRLDHQ